MYKTQSKEYMVVCTSYEEAVARYWYTVGYFRGKGCEFRHIPNGLFIDFIGILFVSWTDAESIKAAPSYTTIVYSDTESITNMLNNIERRLKNDQLP